jgi:hypothetical protein
VLARKYQESTLHSISKTFRWQKFCEPAVRTERESRRFKPDRLVANFIHGAAKGMKVNKHSDCDPMGYHSTYCSTWNQGATAAPFQGTSDEGRTPCPAANLSCGVFRAEAPTLAYIKTLLTHCYLLPTTNLDDQHQHRQPQPSTTITLKQLSSLISF